MLAHAASLSAIVQQKAACTQPAAQRRGDRWFSGRMPAMKMARRLLGGLLVFAAVATAQYRDRQTWAERDQWERPAEVLDKLHVQAGSSVGDVGAGEGYFTVKMAERVGVAGKVYAVDVDPSAVANLRKLAQERGLKQVEVIEGKPDDPRLPEGKLDAILVVNAYHEFRRHDAMLAAFRKAL